MPLPVPRRDTRGSYATPLGLEYPGGVGTLHPPASLTAARACAPRPCWHPAATARESMHRDHRAAGDPSGTRISRRSQYAAPLGEWLRQPQGSSVCTALAGVPCRVSCYAPCVQGHCSPMRNVLVRGLGFGILTAPPRGSPRGVAGPGAPRVPWWVVAESPPDVSKRFVGGAV